jgi:hypothetical protein
VRGTEKVGPRAVGPFEELFEFILDGEFEKFMKCEKGEEKMR